MTHHCPQLHVPWKHPFSANSVKAQPESGPTPVMVPDVEPAPVPLVAELSPVLPVLPVELLLPTAVVEAGPVEELPVLTEPELAAAVTMLPVVPEDGPVVAPAPEVSPVAEKQPVSATIKSAPVKIQRSSDRITGLTGPTCARRRSPVVGTAAP